ncbi:prophage tail fiber N-terminal domain-containing protein [Pectobacterium brasiliense]|uniref:phage tail fiber protein n=1 Tax=Pectobacterium brasiliense TaxID=180957 RepID=UPI00196965CA|nr:prophage tail fiber N-terminal domain-containing protein [Pectobacterium brasiliense]
MSVLISGVLMNPAGVPVSGAEVTFSALTNGPSVLNGFSASVMTDQDGNYAIPLEICEYVISIQSDGYNSVYGSVSINEKSTPATINELLKLAAMEQTVTPSIIVYFREIQADVTAKLVTMQTLGTNAAEAAAAAIAAKNEAAQYAQNLSAAVAQAQQASTAATASANAASNSANGALVAKNAAETAAGNAQATLANAMLKGQFGWGGKAVFVGAGVNLFDYFTVNRPSGLYWSNPSVINKPAGFTNCILHWNVIDYAQFFGVLTAYEFPDAQGRSSQISVNQGIWENSWATGWNSKSLSPVTTNTSQAITARKTFYLSGASVGIQPITLGGASFYVGEDNDGSLRWYLGYPNDNLNGLVLRNHKANIAIGLDANGDLNLDAPRVKWTQGKGFVRNAQAAPGFNGIAAILANWRGEQSMGSVLDTSSNRWRSFINVRHRGGNANQEGIGTDSGDWGFVFVDDNMTDNNHNFRIVKMRAGAWGAGVDLYHTGNATADANGNLKVASPIVKLFADGSSQLNAESDGVVTERLSEGVYHITGCLGLNADRAWGGEDGGITNPRCRNGYERIWNDYEVQGDGSLIIRTYHRVHGDAMPFAQNRLNLDHRLYNEERDSEEWPDRSPIDIPLGTYLTVRVQMPVREEERYVPATHTVSHSNVYCNSVSPA